MFHKSRKKIILAIMGSLILLFSITLTVILLVSFREVRQKNTDMLNRYAEMYSLEQQADRQNRFLPEFGSQNLPGTGQNQGRPPINERPDYQLSTFYSVALSEDGTVLAVDTGEKTVYEESTLVEIAKEILVGNRTSGRRNHLSYIVNRRDGYTLIAFMDNTVSEGGLHTLLHNILIVGSIAIVLLFFISLSLSRRIIRPLEENDRQQKRFISDAGHELKTPVAVISANTELLSRELGENEWLANIQYENERMGDLVKQLLDLSRAENTEAPMVPVDFSRVVAGETLAFESFAFEQGKTIRSDLDDGIHVMGNPAQLTQLTSILLDNAVRHSTGNDIEVLLKHPAHSAVLRVANDDPEIPSEKMEHLFDRFYRVDEARNSEGHHYGLGLSIAKAITEKHGGSIAVSSHDGRVRLTVSIPEKNK